MQSRNHDLFPAFSLLTLTLLLMAGITGLGLPSGSGVVSASSSQGPFVKSTLSIYNGKAIAGGSSAVFNGYGPSIFAYDASGNRLFALTADSQTISVISVSSASVSGYIHLPAYTPNQKYTCSYPSGSRSSSVAVVFAFDPTNDEIFVPRYTFGTSNCESVTAINSVSGNPVANITVGGGATGTGALAYDPSTRDMIVPTNSGFVAIGGSNQIDANVTIGTGGHWFSAVAFNSANGDLYFAEQETGKIYVVDQSYRLVTIVSVSVNENNVNLAAPIDGLLYDQNRNVIFAQGTYYNFTMGTPSFKWCGIAPTGAIQGCGYVIAIDGNQNSEIGFVKVAPPSSMAYDSSNNNLYVGFGDRYGAHFSVVNATTLKVRYNVTGWSRCSTCSTTGDFMGGSIYLPSAGKVAFANPYQNTIFIFDPTINKVAESVDLETSSPRAIAYDSADNRLYVTNPDLNDVMAIDLSNYQVISSISLGIFTPSTILYDSANGMVYIGEAIRNSSYGSNPPDLTNGSIAVVNPHDNAVLERVVLNYSFPWGGATFPVSLVLNPSAGLIYVSQEPGALGVFNIALNRITSTEFVGLNGYPAYPTGIAYDSSSGLLYVGTSYGIDILDSRTLQPVARQGLGFGGNQQIEGVQIDSATDTLLVSFGNSCSSTRCNGGVAVYNLTSNHLISSSSVPWFVPINILNIPSAGYFLTDSNMLMPNDTILALSASNARPVSAVQVGVEPAGMALNEANGEIYVANFESGTITVLTTSPSAVTTTSAITSYTTNSGTAASSSTSNYPTASESSSSSGGGIPEFPYQGLLVVALTIAVAVSYLVTRRGREL